MKTDPYSLDRLQDIAAPEPVSWWPPAAVWWFLLALVAVWVVYGFALAIHRWIGNAYRRQALRELHELEQSFTVEDSPPKSIQLGTLLKRVALVSFPRQKVASLSGEAWLKFLNGTCDQVDFSQGPSKCLGSVSCDPTTAPDNHADFRQMIATARTWIDRHQGEVRE